MKKRNKKIIKELQIMIKQADTALYFAGFNQEDINVIYKNVFKITKQLINEQKQ